LVEPRLRRLAAARGRALLSAGARPDNVFLVEAGQARVVLYSSAGREVLVRDLGPGDIFGELAALDGRPRAASVVAITDLEVVMMSAADFLACAGSSSQAALWLARRLSAEVRRLTEKVFELSALNVQARLHCELLRLSRDAAVVRKGAAWRIAPAPTHAELAGRIGTQRESVTRELRALAARGVIRQLRGTIEVRDLEQLSRWAASDEAAAA